jgi:hypothetical protein
MKYLKIYEDYNLKSPLIELIEKLDNLVNYDYNDDDEIKITIKSKDDKSKSCPYLLDFIVKYNKIEDSFIIKNLTTNEEIGEYYLPEAIPVINYAYRNY